MSNKITFHTDCNYEQELIDLLRVKQETIPNYDAELNTRIVQDFLNGKYGEDNINAFATDAQVVDPSVHHIGKSDAPPYLMYNNLYTFVLLKGINVPYQEWVFNLSYYCELTNKEYRYDNNNGMCYVKNMPPIIPQETQDLITILRGEVELHRRTLEFEAKKRKELERIVNQNNMSPEEFMALQKMKSQGFINSDTMSLLNQHTGASSYSGDESLVFPKDGLDELIKEAKKIQEGLIYHGTKESK